MSYKISQYTYILKLDEARTVLFNGYSKQFAVVSTRQLDKYLLVLKNGDDLNKFKNKSVTAILQDLLKANILVDSTVNEFERIKNNIQSYINRNEFHTMILPTYDCNYHCWYCIQKHQQTQMSSNVVKLVKKHILNYLADYNIPKYILYWFGGEPLLQKQIIYELSLDVYEYCHRNNIQFVGQVTTNGALLDIPTINMLQQVHIDNYQITLDGDKSLHDEIKHDNSPSSFELITGNISNLLQINEKASIILRVNYTPDSISHLAIVDDLEKNIPLRFRSRILVDLHKIWQVNEEDVSLEKLDLLQKKFVEKHFRLNTCGMFEPCYVEKRHFETIYYNGKVDICDNFAHGNARGVITNEGYVNWGQENVFPEIPSECMGCVYYPVCLGECPAIRLKNKQQGKTFVCNASVKEHIEFAIKDYCLRTINNKKLS